jgi:flagellum-specific ATP synthase
VVSTTVQAELHRWRSRLERRVAPIAEGSVTRMIGLTIEAVGCQAAVGAICRIIGGGGQRVEAEVVGFSGDKLYLMPTAELRGLTASSRVVPTDHVEEVGVGTALLGRVLDGGGRPLDNLPPPRFEERVPISGIPINPLLRVPIREPLDVGLRSINALLTVGRGQRLGLFAGSGVGKSVLLGMMTRFTAADVIVVGLIGERGREARDFIENIIGREGMAKTVVVVTPSNDPPLKRLHGAMLATAIAEHFRDRGRHVLLLMDSITRFAQAQREIALSVGEPPATRGYPPSVFASIPQLVERAGNSAAQAGSMTAIYTVLLEGDDRNDPVADAVRATLDGHIVLSRRMADAGVYPAIDVEASTSRVFPDITSADHQEAVRRFRALNATYQENRDLISIGAYQSGSDRNIDEAVEYQPRLLDFLRQGMRVAHGFDDSVRALKALMGKAERDG